VVSLLKNLNVDFKDLNVLTDSQIRKNIKIYCDWLTIPQLYVKGQFVGGCDIIKELHSQGKLSQMLHS
jgi:monothiol glutaredoxin